MKNSIKALLISISLIMAYVTPSSACTSVIISSKATVSGKPLMMKHRDTGELNNRIEYFKGTIYSFIGLVNSPSEGGEVWTGTNSAGFSIMNTASYNIKDDDVPEEMMDKEGELMFRALGICATLSDFEKFLDNISKPYGVETNYGVIDASGGAAYYEVNNSTWVKYDVNESERGYRVVTNFSESGRKEDYKGYERYLTASAIMNDMYAEAKDGKMDVNPHDLFYNISRSYRHTLTGIDFLNDFNSLKKNYGFTGIIADQDFIPRKSTSASIVVEGVKPGEDPLHTVMWTILGYPACSVTVPLLVGDEDMLPSFVKSTESSKNCPMCDFALRIREKQIYGFNISNRGEYIDINPIMDLLHSCLMTESYLEEYWLEIYNKWITGRMDFDTFKKEYSDICIKYYDSYLNHFTLFLQ